MLVDSHCHLDRLDYDKKHHDLADVLHKAGQRGVSHFLSVSVTLEAFPAMLTSVLPYPNVFASCGVHPLDLESPWSGELLRELAVHPRVVAIGETGLDYYYSTENKAEQQHAFREHIRVSRELKKNQLLCIPAMPKQILWPFYGKSKPVKSVVYCIASLKTGRWRKMRWIWGCIFLFPGL